jgi:hypothetical protein
MQFNTGYGQTSAGGFSFNTGNGSGNVMTILGTGNVGIGTATPGYKLEVLGGVSATNLASSSDRRFKTSITPIDSSLSKIEKLQGVYYDWDRAKWPKKNFPEGKQVGLIAQDVEKVVPEVVNTDKEGYKSLSYDKLTAVLIEAVKEQEKQITAQQQDIATQNKLIESQKITIEQLSKRIDGLEKKKTN